MNDFALEYIRETYGVPANRGRIVAFHGKLGVITKGKNAYVMIKLSEEKQAAPYHPGDIDFYPEIQVKK